MSRFEINAVSGVVTVKTCGTPGKTPCIDYERKQRYDLAVQALDNEGGIGALPGTAQLIIDVEDVNDNQPSFISDYYRFILEGNVTTTDPLVIKVSLRIIHLRQYRLTWLCGSIH